MPNVSATKASDTPFFFNSKNRKPRMPHTTTSRPRQVLPSGMVVKILPRWQLVPAKKRFHNLGSLCYSRNKMPLQKKPTPTLPCLPLVSETFPLLRFCAAEKNKHFPHRHATTDMNRKILASHLEQGRDDTDQNYHAREKRSRANMFVYLTESPIAQYEQGRDTTDRNERFCACIFRK